MKKHPEKSRFAVPVAVAVAAHAFLFFGFKSPTVVLTPKVITTTPDPFPQEPVPVDLAPPETPPDDTKESSVRQILAAPTLPEVLPTLSPLVAILVPAFITTGPMDPHTNLIPTEPPRMGTLDGRTSGPTTIGLGDLDNPPRATFQARPNYPFTLRQQGVSGEVVVNFLVDEQGRVSDVRVVRSSHAEFEFPTVSAVGRWRFEPGKRQGRAVRFRMSQSVSFAVGE